MSAAQAPLIEAQGLHVHVGPQALLHGVGLAIGAGERVAVVGHNGAGKSTLLRALGGFAPVSQGRLRVLDTELAGRLPPAALRQLRARVAQVHQGLHLVGRRSALDNVLIGGAARCPSPGSWFGRWPAHERASAMSALARVGMGGAASRRTDGLSGGERQKIAIARALHQGGTLLLADEPTASLDEAAAGEVVRLLREVADERHVTLVCVVHDLALVPRLADRVVALRRGAVLADMAVSEHTPARLREMLS